MTFYRCPTDPAGAVLDPVMGCGHVFEQEAPDHEGFVDCAHCGMFFKPRPQDIIDQPELPGKENAL